jgi:hypothetical protein
MWHFLKFMASLENVWGNQFLNQHRTMEWLMNRKWFQRKQSWPNWGIIPAFARTEEKRKTSISVVAAIQTEHPWIWIFSITPMPIQSVVYSLLPPWVWGGPTVLCISWSINKLLTNYCNGIALRILCPIWLLMLDVDSLLATALACALL